MSFISELKDKLKKHEPKDFVQSIRNNPEYSNVLGKLKELTEKRDALHNMLRKTELEIDACLVMIEMKHEKENIEKDIDYDKLKELRKMEGKD